MTFEPIIMQYLASQGLFLSPQFSIRVDNREWSCPDFVAIDFLNSEVQVVEVSTAYDINGLVGKIRERESQWFEKLRAQLPTLGVPEKEWKYVVHVFIRSDRKEYIAKEFSGQTDVRITAIEEVAFRWTWPWDAWHNTERGQGQFPGKQRKSSLALLTVR